MTLSMTESTKREWKRRRLVVVIIIAGLVV